MNPRISSFQPKAASGAPVSVGRVTFAAMVRLLGWAMFSSELDVATSAGDPRQRAGSHSAVHSAQCFQLVPGGHRGQRPGLTATDVETDCEVALPETV